MGLEWADQCWAHCTEIYIHGHAGSGNRKEAGVDRAMAPLSTSVVAFNHSVGEHEQGVPPPHMAVT